MAKRKVARRARAAKSARKTASTRASVKRQKAKRPAARKPKAKAPAQKRKITPKKKAAPAKSRAGAPMATRAPKGARTPATGKVPRLERARRTLDEETLVTPPSSLDMDRRGSAARSGRAEMAQNAREHRGMSPDITGGDVDVDVEDAYFTGDEAPGGENPSPDLEVVDDIGKALGVTYDDAEELKSGDKLEERDKHRWEMDPASSEDYKDRD